MYWTLDLKLYVTTRFKFKFKLIQFDSVIVKCALIFKFEIFNSRRFNVNDINFLFINKNDILKKSIIPNVIILNTINL